MSTLEWGPLQESDLPGLGSLARSCLRQDGGLPQLATEVMLRYYFLGGASIGGRDVTGELVAAVRDAIRAETGITTELSTTGGTSDGRFMAKLCSQVIEFGPINASIHKINENVRLADIDPLKNIYKGVLERLAGV